MTMMSRPSPLQFHIGPPSADICMGDEDKSWWLGGAGTFSAYMYATSSQNSKQVWALKDTAAASNVLPVVCSVGRKM